MASFYQVFKNEPICKHAAAYCEYDGDVEVVCGKCQHGKLFCYKCNEYEPRKADGKAKNNTVDKCKECFTCYGSHTGVCKNTNTIVKDTSCPFNGRENIFREVY